VSTDEASMSTSMCAAVGCGGSMTITTVPEMT
jgi:hypothetical protein